MWWWGSERLDDDVWELVGSARWPRRRGEEVVFGCDEAWVFSVHLYIGRGAGRRPVVRLNSLSGGGETSRHRLLEGNGRGGKAASFPLRRRWLEVSGAAAG
jgi:hypothetical protein